MQSVGQTGRHSLQPVHSFAITVCINLADPMMQSTGQALMQSLHPMQSDSSITASTLRFDHPIVRVERLYRPAGEVRQRRNGDIRSRRALVDIRFPGCDRHRILPATGIITLGTLGLRQQSVDAIDERVPGKGT